MNVTQLATKREQLAHLTAEAKEIARKSEEENRPMTDEEIVRSEEITTELAPSLKKEIKTLELQEAARSMTSVQRDAGSNKAPSIVIAKKADPRDNDFAFRAWLLNGTPYQRNIEADWCRSADRLNLDWQAKTWLIRDQSSDTATEGGEARHESLFQGVVDAKKAYGGIESVSTVIRTDTNEPIHFMINDDTSNLAGFDAENTTVDNVGVEHDTVALNAYLVSSAVYPVSLQLLRSARIDMAAYYGRKLGERIARKLNLDFTKGGGTTEPTGVESAQGAVGLSHLITSEDLYDLYFSVDHDYRNSPNCVWMMTDLTLADLMGSLTSELDGRPLWGEGLNSAPGQSLLGKRIVINNDLDNMDGATKKPILFGDFSHHHIRYVGNIELIKDYSAFATKLAVGLLAWAEVDSKTVNPGNDPIKHLSTGVTSGDSEL